MLTHVPVTAGPIVVMATCQLAVLHSGRSLSVLSLDVTPAAESGATHPDTDGDAHFACYPEVTRMLHVIRSEWLPRDGD